MYKYQEMTWFLRFPYFYSLAYKTHHILTGKNPSPLTHSPLILRPQFHSKKHANFPASLPLKRFGFAYPESIILPRPCLGVVWYLKMDRELDRNSYRRQLNMSDFDRNMDL